MINVSAMFDYPQIRFDKESEINLDIILSAPEHKNQKRIPLHIILALDLSGSMDGGKLESVKKTTYKLVDHLTENDTLGIIGFSKDVWDVFKALPMTKENKEVAKTAVKALHTIGATNLSDAMILAMERAVISNDSKVCRIILLTDGLPTAGDCDKKNLIELASKMNPSVSLSTFGYGMDFDAELMASISSTGRGSSFYIKVDEDCNKAFAMELGGLLSLYSQNIKMTITPSGNVEFKELLSDYKCEQKQGYRLLTNKKTDVQIDDIFAGEKKHIILKLVVPKASEAVCARTTRVCTIEITYTEVETKNKLASTINGSVKYVKPDKAPTTPNEEVWKQLLIIEAAKIQKEAQEKADQGERVGRSSHPHIIMGRYNLATGKKKNSLAPRKANLQELPIYRSILAEIASQSSCIICENKISEEWLEGNPVSVCPKKSCWEKFLPTDLVKKYLTSKTRYDLLKEKNA